MSKEISSGAVVFRRKKDKIYYLLLHYDAGHWDFPKGHIEKGETDIETMKREIWEETGIKDIRVIKGFREYIKYFFRNIYNLSKKDKGKAEWIFKIVIYFLAETETENIKISFEHIGYKWLVYNDALKQITFKNSKEILKKANNFLLKTMAVKNK